MLKDSKILLNECVTTRRSILELISMLSRRAPLVSSAERITKSRFSRCIL